MAMTTRRSGLSLGKRRTKRSSCQAGGGHALSATFPNGWAQEWRSRARLVCARFARAQVDDTIGRGGGLGLDTARSDDSKG